MPNKSRPKKPTPPKRTSRLASLRTEHEHGNGWPPTTEVLFMVPVAVLLMAAGYADFYAVGPAVAIITVGGVGVAWLSGAALAAGPQPCGPGRVAGHIIACITAVIALCYIALHRGHLIDLIIETVRFGPDV